MRARAVIPLLLTAREVAEAFGVDQASVTRRGREGRLLRTGGPGRDHRFYAAEVDALQEGKSPREARALAEAERERLAGGAR